MSSKTCRKVCDVACFVIFVLPSTVFNVFYLFLKDSYFTLKKNHLWGDIVLHSFSKFPVFFVIRLRPWYKILMLSYLLYLMKYLSIAVPHILMLGAYANCKRRAWDNNLRVKVFNSTSK